MDLEKVLAEDRVLFETQVAAVSDPREQTTAGMNLYHRLIGYMGYTGSELDRLTARIDAFMHLCVKYKVCKELAGLILRSVYSGSKFNNRDALIEYFNTFPPTEPLFTESLKVSYSLLTEPTLNNEYVMRKQRAMNDLYEHNRTTMRPDRAKVVELEKLCEEYQDWLRRMRLGRKNMDPKNYPSQDELRVRDSIRAKIMEVATPDLLLQMAVQVLQHGEFNE